jgi:hypothetical protein
LQTFPTHEKFQSSYNMLVFNSLWFALFCYKDLFCIWRDSLFCCLHGCVQAISARLILSQRLRKRENIMGFLNSMWLIVSFAYENQNDNYTFFYSSTCQNCHIKIYICFVYAFFLTFIAMAWVCEIIQVILVLSNSGSASFNFFWLLLWLVIKSIKEREMAMLCYSSHSIPYDVLPLLSLWLSNYLSLFFLCS